MVVRYLLFLGTFIGFPTRMLLGFTHSSCTRSRAAQFSFPNCYIPSLDTDLPLSQASFLMSHDATTGYLPPNRMTGAVNLYAKNQMGTLYQQLQDGARAFDVRPKFLANGTVVFHHGAITVPVTLEQVLRDVSLWAVENPDELVLLFHFRPSFETGMSVTEDTAVTTLSQVYEAMGVPYRSCRDLYGLTVGETMELALMSSGGHVLALDHQDQYLSSCVKMNYVLNQIVTCYPRSSATSSSSSDNTRNNSTIQSTIPPCIKPIISPTLGYLKAYTMASANSEPSDSSNQLGPPASLETYPFFAIQALWQVDTYSAASGVAHLSSLLDDNTKSQVNARVVDWIYEGAFQNISLMMVDHVQLNGNAILSVLRTQCGQAGSVMEDACGKAISKPRLQQKPMSTMTFWMTCLVYAGFGTCIVIMARHYRKYYRHDQEVARLKAELRQSLDDYHILCHGGGEMT